MVTKLRAAPSGAKEGDDLADAMLKSGSFKKKVSIVREEA